MPLRRKRLSWIHELGKVLNPAALFRDVDASNATKLLLHVSRTNVTSRSTTARAHSLDRFSQLVLNLSRIRPLKSILQTCHSAVEPRRLQELESTPRVGRRSAVVRSPSLLKAGLPTTLLMAGKCSLHKVCSYESTWFVGSRQIKVSKFGC
jgi:hypothetical protein